MGQFEDMQAFVRIVDAGSISNAAEQLGVTKSSLSRRLSDLEGRLGTQLLARTTRRSSLTEAGERYYTRAQQILSDVAELTAATTDQRARLEGQLKVAVPVSFGIEHLAPLINAFAATHPQLVVNLAFEDRHIDLVEEGFDLAIRIARLKDSNLIARKLVPVRRVVCASPAYLETQGAPQMPEDLKHHDVLHYTNAPGATWHFTDRDGRARQVRPPVRMAANNGDFLSDAAQRGLGIAQLPTFMVHRQLADGRLVAILTDYGLEEMNAYALYPSTQFVPARVRALIDHLVEHLGPCPPWDREGHADGAA